MQRSRFTSEKLAELQEAFKLCDKDNDGEVDTLVTSIYYQGISTFSKIILSDSFKLIAEIMDFQNRQFNFYTFFDMKSQYREPQTEDELIDAMNSIFKPSVIKISMKQFKNIISNLGQKLSQDQLNELFKQLKLQNKYNFDWQDLSEVYLPDEQLSLIFLQSQSRNS